MLREKKSIKLKRKLFSTKFSQWKIGSNPKLIDFIKYIDNFFSILNIFCHGLKQKQSKAMVTDAKRK